MGKCGKIGKEKSERRMGCRERGEGEV